MANEKNEEAGLKESGPSATSEAKAVMVKEADDNKATLKSSKKDEPTKNPVAETLQFLKEVRIEFHKISWPTFPQVVRETWAVLFLVAAFTLMVLAFDWVLSNGVFGPLEHWARLHGGGVGGGK